MDEREALELLRASHTFPGPYRFRVVVAVGGRASVVTAVRAFAGERLQALDEQPSKKGTYVSVRLTLQLEQASDVLDTYELLRAIDGVLTVM